jgi:hypothetical protein
MSQDEFLLNLDLVDIWNDLDAHRRLALLQLQVLILFIHFNDLSDLCYAVCKDLAVLLDTSCIDLPILTFDEFE